MLIVVLGVATNFIVKSGSYPAKLKRITQFYEEGNAELAMKEINELDPKFKKDPLILWYSAKLYYKQNQYILAMASLQSMLDGAYFTKDVTELKVREFLANIYEETGNSKKALDEYDYIIKIKNQDYDSLYKAGLISYQSGEWILAQKYLSLAATRNDSNPELLYMLAYSYYKMRTYHAAQQNIEKAIALDSSK